MADRPPPPPPPPPDQGDGTRSEGPWNRWLIWALVLAILAAFVLPSIFGSGDGEEVTYNDFLQEVTDGNIAPSGDFLGVRDKIDTKRTAVHFVHS